MTKRSLFIRTLAATILCLMPLEIHAGGPSTSKQLSREFIEVGKTAKPAVVSIKATLTKKGLANRQEQSEDPMDPFQDEFWRRFFGHPNQQRPERKQPAAALGSGFTVSADGYILTNNHVVQDADNITVTFTDGKEYKAKLIGSDPNTDVAVVKIEAKNLPYLKLGNSDDLEVGEWVVAIGNPLGLQASLSVGHVSAIGRNDLDITRVEEFIQTDAAINRGNSGGPLLTLDKEVIGINTAIASSTGGHMGIGFAIPSNLVKRVMAELIEHGKIVRGFIGVNLQKVDSKIAEAFGLTKAEGALVTDVIKDGPADKAGIKPGDIILKVNNQSINNVGSLRNFVSFLHPNDVALITLQRRDENMQLREMQIKVHVGTHPDSEIAANEMQDNIGLVVEALTPEIAEDLGVKEDKGVVIKYVTPGSIADYEGLKRGQIILSINRTPIKTPEEFYKQIQEKAAGSQILLHVREGSVTRFIVLRVE